MLYVSQEAFRAITCRFAVLSHVAGGDGVLGHQRFGPARHRGATGESLKISAEDNLLPRLTSEVEGDTLILGEKPNTRIVTTKPISYTLTMKDISGLALSGSGTISAAKLTTAALRTTISGSGVITTGGSANDQDVDISGSGRYLADGLTSKTVKAEISGSGTASVVATELLDVKISGSGTLTYSGNPQVTQTLSGSGKLIKK